MFAASILWTDPSFAQRNPVPARAPSQTPPGIQGSTDVPYPKGANGNAVARLELTIEKDGRVSSAVVTEGNSSGARSGRAGQLSDFRDGGIRAQRIGLDSSKRSGQG